MKIHTFCLLLVFMYSSSLPAMYDTSTGLLGFEVQLQRAESDHRTYWWLALLNGQPLRRIPSDNNDKLRFFVPEYLVQKHSGLEHRTVTLALHIRKPQSLLDNNFAFSMNIGQRHYSFLIILELRENTPHYRTIPETNRPIFADIRYTQIQRSFESCIVIELHSFKDIWQLIAETRLANPNFPNSFITYPFKVDRSVYRNSGNIHVIPIYNPTWLEWLLSPIYWTRQQPLYFWNRQSNTAYVPADPRTYHR